MRRALASRALPLAGAALALLLTVPALGNGWYFDDLPQRLVLTRHPLAGVPPSKMFAFLSGDPAANHRLLDIGTIPWWSDPGLRLALWRPLTVWTHQLDQALWPDSAAVMHLHSIAWLAALVLCVGFLYLRVLGATWIAGLAALLYAVDDAHGFPAGWLANRNALITTTFGVLALVGHDRWRRGGWRPGRWLAPASFAAALLSGEFGLGIVAYFVAHAIVLEPGRGWRRLRSMTPYAVLFAAWAAYYTASRYGVAGSGLYVDPLEHPAGFVRALIERAPVLLLGQWALPMADSYSQLSGDAALLTWCLALLALAWIAVAVAPLVRRDPAARFFGLGMILALVPVCATFPANRLLFFVGIGAMGLIAQLLAGLVERAPWRPAARPWHWAARALGAVLVPIHLVLAPAMLPWGAMLPRVLGVPTLAAMESLPRDSALVGQDLVIVNAPDHFFYVSNIGVLDLLEDDPLPRHLRGLVAAPVPVTLTRLDERSLRVDLPHGLLRGTLGALFRGPRNPLRAGDRIVLSGMSVEVLEATLDRGPASVVFRFDAALEDPSLRWVRWEDDGFVRFVPPAVGRTVRLPAPRGVLEMSDSGEMMAAYRRAEARRARLRGGG